MSVIRSLRIDFRRLDRAEAMQIAGGVAAGLSLALPWYRTDANEPNATIDGRVGEVSAWAAHPTLRWLLLAAVAGAFISAWQTARAHKVGWQRGEMATIVATIVAGLILAQGFIARPGEPSGTTGLGVGWFVALAASLVAVGAAASRIPAPPRQPPGT